MITFKQEDRAETPVARIKVLGIGGAGGNTINHMRRSNYDRVEFLVANTDAQALAVSEAPVRLQLGTLLTRGLGAGANPEVGRSAAHEDLEAVMSNLRDADIVFLVAGLGGGTGSGATPVIARALKEAGILTVAVVTKPFAFEGKRSLVIANEALTELGQSVDTLVVIPNERLLRVTDAHVSMLGAFAMINDVIHQFVKSIADIISYPGHINVDFADLCTIMRGMGTAVMGTGRAAGVDRAQKAAAQAISSPLLENATIEGAQAILLNITGSSGLGLHELHAAASAVYEATAEEANIIMGSVIDESMGDEVTVTIIATGILERDRKEASVTTIRAAMSVSEVLTDEGQSSSPSEHSQDELAAHEMDAADPETRELEVPTYLRQQST